MRISSSGMSITVLEVVGMSCFVVHDRFYNLSSLPFFLLLLLLIFCLVLLLL